MKVSELVERLQADRDDRKSAEKLYEFTSARLLRRIQERIPPRLRPRLDAEDVFHEAFIRALTRIETFQSTREDSFVAWIDRIAMNLIADCGKRRSAGAIRFAREAGEKGPRESTVLPRRARSPETQLQRRDWIDSILSRMPEKEAEVIRLRHLQDRSFEEIASSWEKTPGAVQRFFSRAWQRFCKIAQLRSD